LHTLLWENCIEITIHVADLIDGIEGVAIYVILGDIVIVLRVLHKCNLVTHFFIQEEAQCFSD
jgi:hypothetical protein